MTARAILLLALLACCCTGGKAAKDWRTSGAFQQAVSGANRVVVREGGALCCRPRTNCHVFAVITDTNAIAVVRAHIRFKPDGDTGDCECCGFPGIDWFKGTNLLAVTAIHHGNSFHWVGSGGTERAELTAAAGCWLTNWCTRLGLRNEDLR